MNNEFGFLFKNKGIDLYKASCESVPYPLKNCKDRLFVNLKFNGTYNGEINHEISLLYHRDIQELRGK